jgi:hypothetical protein
MAEEQANIVKKWFKLKEKNKGGIQLKTSLME